MFCVRYFKRFQSFITTLHWTAEKKTNLKTAKRATITMDGKLNQMHINWLLHIHTLSQLANLDFFSFFFFVFSLVCSYV